MAEKLSRITDSILRLESEQPKVFGAGEHRFRLKPKLPEPDILAFERLHNISLPGDYREFLANVGNGGAGPFYGVFPLGQIDGPFGMTPWQANDGLVGILSERFPFEDSWNDISAMPSNDLLHRDEDEYVRQMDIFEKVYWSSTLTNGAFPICHQGCALRILLVVTGPQAGFLWDDRRSEYSGLKPLQLADGSPATFLRWYEEWLNECLAAL